MDIQMADIWIKNILLSVFRCLIISIESFWPKLPSFAYVPYSDLIFIVDSLSNKHMWAETAKTTWGLTEIGDKQGSLRSRRLHSNLVLCFHYLCMYDLNTISGNILDPPAS